MDPQYRQNTSYDHINSKPAVSEPESPLKEPYNSLQKDRNSQFRIGGDPARSQIVDGVREREALAVSGSLEFPDANRYRLKIPPAYVQLHNGVSQSQEHWTWYL